jgi:GNAT superfamily N-acetyltransferase
MERVPGLREAEWARADGRQASCLLGADRRVQGEQLRRFLGQSLPVEMRRESAPRRFCILVVDDEELVRDYVADMLQGSSLDCVVAVISVHQLRQREMLAGQAAYFDGTFVAPPPSPPAATDADAVHSQVLWDFLKGFQGWDCLNVAARHGAPLRKLIEADFGCPVGAYDDVYHILSRPVAVFESPFVRLLTPDDVGLLRSAPRELRESGFGDPDVLLSDGIAAAGVVDGRVVSIAHTFPPTGRHADLGVYTVARLRRRGLATAAASTVVRRAQEMGFVPVWRTEHDNTASLRVAQKLGFTEACRRTYVVPPGS